MTEPLDSVLAAARLLATDSPARSGELIKLIRSKFFLTHVQKLKNLAEARESFLALGQLEFRSLVAQLDEKKAAGLLKKIDKHAPPTEPGRAPNLAERIVDLASGVTVPTPAASKTKIKKTAKASIPQPDIRLVYRSGGNDAVDDAVGSLSLAELRAIVSDQNLRATISKGAGAPGLRKFIQVAVKEELGSRADAIGAIASQPDRED